MHKPQACTQTYVCKNSGANCMLINTCKLAFRCIYTENTHVHKCIFCICGCTQKQRHWCMKVHVQRMQIDELIDMEIQIWTYVKGHCTNACTCTHTHTHSLSGMNLKRKGERMRNVYVLKFLLAITQITSKSVKQKREKKSIPDRRGSRSCEINYILFLNIIQRSLHSFRKVWSCRGGKEPAGNGNVKGMPSSRQRPVLRSEMMLSSSLAGEGGWEGFKCPDSNNGHEGYLMWHWSPHWLLSLTWSIRIKK